MQKDYSILEHPSDLGIEARGSSLIEVFQNAATALMSIIFDLKTVTATECRHITVSAIDEEQMLVKWLSEILYVYDGQRFACSEFNIAELDRTHLEASVWGEMFLETKHRPKLDVKAVTYHQLSVKENDNGWIVRVFFDI